MGRICLLAHRVVRHSHSAPAVSCGAAAEEKTGRTVRSGCLQILCLIRGTHKDADTIAPFQVDAHFRHALFLLGLVLAVTGQALPLRTRAATTGAAGGQWKFALVWLVAFASSIAALVQAYLFYKWVANSDPGNERMVEIAGYVRQGANAYLWQQYIVVACFFGGHRRTAVHCCLWVESAK